MTSSNSSAFSEFCGGSFWDTNLTWYSSPPDVTSCFQQSVLVWGPCGYLWVALPFYFLYLYRRDRACLHCSKLTIAKVVLSVFAALTSCLDVIWYFTDATSPPLIHLLSPIIRALTLFLAAFLHYIHVKRGTVTSGVLFIFWLFIALVSLIPFYTNILHAVQQHSVENLAVFVTFYFYCAAVWVLLVLSCFAEALPVGDSIRPPCPESASSFLNRMAFSWVTSLMVQGYKKPLKEEDVFDIKEEDKSSNCVPVFEAAWNKELQRCNWQKSGGSSGGIADSYQELGPLLSSDTEPLVEVVATTKVKHPSLLWVLTKVYGPRLMVSHFCKLCQDLLVFAFPVLQSQLIDFTTLGSDEKKQFLWKGMFYAALFVVAMIVDSIFFQQVFHIGMTLGMQVKSAITAAVYKKALTVSNDARRETTVGEIVNLMSVDAERLQEVVTYLWLLWSCVLLIGISMYMLYTLLGLAVFAGLGVMILLFPLNGGLAAVMEKLEEKQMKIKDNRIKLLNEVLNGIKVLKLYAWELSFQEKVNVIRRQELKNLKKFQYLGGLTMFTWTMASFLVMLATLATYVLTGHTLDAKKAFVTLTLFNILQVPINLLPMMISYLVTARVSLKRVSKFLLQGDIERSNVEHSSFTDNAVEIMSGAFTWVIDEDPTLKNVNVAVAPGSLIAVVGTVGAGKSSLISAILGEMHKVDGTVNVNGQVAYVAQQAWIQNDTLKDNILFHSDFSQEKYDKVVEACALKADLEMLPAGDQTEIGEKGINLSGGQKQRVSLARAVYRSADIYLLDDPLSAVDAHVGKHIFNTCIGKEGVLKDKTRILVTHGIQWLPHVDQILVVDNGTISESGGYEELLSHNGPFAQFIRTYLAEAQEEDVDEEFAETRKALLERVESMEDPPLTPVTPGTEGLPVGSFGSVGSHGSYGSHDTAGTSPSTRRMISRTISETHPVKKIETPDTPLPGKSQQATLIEEEKTEEGSLGWSVLASYMSSLGLVNTLILCFSYMCYQGAAIGANIWLTEWTDDPVFNGSVPSNDSRFQHASDKYLGVYGAFGVAQAVLILFFSLYAAAKFVRAAGIMHHQMLSNILRSPMAFFDTTPIGRILNRFSHDIEVIDNTLPDLFYQWVNSFFNVVAGIVVISYTAPIFLAVTIPLAIIYFFIQRLYVPTSRQLRRLECKTKSPIFSHFSETIAGAATIRAYGQQEYFIEHSATLVDHNNVYYFANICSNRWLNLRLTLLSALVVYVVALFAVLQDNSSGIVGLSITYALQACEEFNWTVRVTSELETELVSVTRVAEYTHTPSEAEWYLEDTKPSADWPQQGRVHFKDYATRYREGLDLVVRNINVRIKGGEKIGIVGRTGAGKSSLTLALFRIIESARGSIRIDSVPIQNLGLHQLRSKLTILPQDPVLFSGTLRMNLDPFDKYSDSEVWQSLERAHLKTYVESLTAGLEHECGEGGQNLSVGQRQLVCLARTLLRKTKLLILDEATAAVDMETDVLIQNTIRTEFASCTVLTIAHRINTIMDNDRILVLDKGQVAEFDTPTELMENKDSIFYSMAKESGLVS